MEDGHLGRERPGVSRAARQRRLATDTACQHCGDPPVLATGRDIYPHRADLHGKRFWVCWPCQAWVGCHPPKRPGCGGHGDGSVPLGRPANAELRALRHRAHVIFDPLWRHKEMLRSDAYRWLAQQLRIPKEECHIGHFDMAQCQAVIAAVKALRALQRGRRGSAPQERNDAP